jgi:hypothetical protein
MPEVVFYVQVLPIYICVYFSSYVYEEFYVHTCIEACIQLLDVPRQY